MRLPGIKTKPSTIRQGKRAKTKLKMKGWETAVMTLAALARDIQKAADAMFAVHHQGEMKVPLSKLKFTSVESLALSPLTI
jgi:hypothetical protein